MAAFSFILVFVLVLSGTTAANVQHALRAHEQSVVSFNAAQLPAYGLYVKAYAKANPAITGEVDNGDVSMPGWFAPAPTLRNYVVTGTAYVYMVPATAADALAAARLIRSGPSGVHVRCGVATGGLIRYPGAGLSAVAVPGAIPDGALVMVF